MRGHTLVWHQQSGWASSANLPCNEMLSVPELGLRVSITEVDIEDPPGDIRPWVDLLGACLENFNCTSFMTWGLDDAHSWLTQNGTCNCLLYDTMARAPEPLPLNPLPPPRGAPYRKPS